MEVEKPEFALEAAIAKLEFTFPGLAFTFPEFGFIFSGFTLEFPEFKLAELEPVFWGGSTNGFGF